MIIKSKTIILHLLRSFLTIALILTTTISFAYFIGGGVIGDSLTDNSSLTIGSWTQAPEGIDAYSDAVGYHSGDLVWFEGEFYEYHGSYSQGNEPSIANNWMLLNDLNWYDSVNYYTDDIIYYQGIVYKAISNGNLNKSPLTYNNYWENMKNNVVSWHSGDAASQHDIYYHEGQLWMYMRYYTQTEPGSNSEWRLVGDLTYNSNYVYADGDLVLHNGTYYVASGWANNSTPGNSGNWIATTMSTWSSSIASGTTYVSYNGLIYEALVSNMTTLRNNEPGTASSKGVWQAITTQEWQPYNTYSVDDLVMYNGSVYMLDTVANSSITPGTQNNSWDLMDTMFYDEFNTYAVGEFAVINDVVYEVVNATNANSHAPGTYANAWNRVSGYDWYWYNVYEAGDVVYHSDGVYVSLTSSTNVEPGTSGSETYWGYYNEN